MVRKSPELTSEWVEFKTTGSREARNKLIEGYYPLVQFVANRMKQKLPATVEEADLVSYGVFGLIDAIDKFDLERKIKFETYAITRIRGAVIDEIRAMDWVPRSVRSKAKDLDRTSSKLETELNRAPSDLELSVGLGMSLTELRSSQNAVSGTHLVPLDEMLGSDGGGLALMDTLKDVSAEDPMASMVTHETVRLLARAMAGLDVRDSTVLSLYYAEALTLQSIGEVLGVTESRVCQLHTRAIQNLRKRLALSVAYE